MRNSVRGTVSIWPLIILTVWDFSCYFKLRFNPRKIRPQYHYSKESLVRMHSIDSYELYTSVDMSSRWLWASPKNLRTNLSRIWLQIFHMLAFFWIVTSRHHIHILCFDASVPSRPMPSGSLSHHILVERATSRSKSPRSGPSTMSLFITRYCLPCYLFNSPSYVLPRFNMVFQSILFAASV